MCTERALAEHRPANGANLISFGRAYMADPSLVELLRTGAPLTSPTATRGTEAATPVT